MDYSNLSCNELFDGKMLIKIFQYLIYFRILRCFPEEENYNEKQMKTPREQLINLPLVRQRILVLIK